MNTEVRTSLDHLLTTLKAELAQPGQSLIPLLTMMSRFTRYSLANQMLIFAQRPTATHVLGYRSWLKAGYQVRKGEKGIAIYAPMRFTREDPDTLEEHSRTGFRVAHVFDLAQVDPLTCTDTAAFAAPLADTPRRPSGERTAESLPLRPQRRARIQAARPRPDGLHRRPSHHLWHRSACTRRVRDDWRTKRATCYCTSPPIAAPAPNSRRARLRRKRSPIRSALYSASPAPTPRSSTSSATAARPTHSMHRSSASAPPRYGSARNSVPTVSGTKRPGGLPLTPPRTARRPARTGASALAPNPRYSAEPVRGVAM